ncbi:putative G3BP-like protein isoform X2 [Brachypodium distachyon]|uniref:putative G3BP-like protein isoform X2 n=1 Tax=Brachypodium distachyon TaxID=15368 RepID=UPI00071CDCF1|nr:putative G3BP-like protein isoform X2 [Brachypodium distachyon]|eukprot:XP_014752407.1 putative G3BP-like protein isoform X2 [Brachypodium distachyon]
MAAQAGTPATPLLSPQVIGSVFVEQYYRIQHATPDQVHKFYQDISRIGRAGSDGAMGYVTTLPEINKKIMSMDFSQYLTEIETADSVLSHNGGVLIVVTGSLTSSDVCQRFTQSFFLAPQESGGYFVLNDILRFISARSEGNGRNQKAGSVTESADPTPAVMVEHMIPDSVVVESNVADGEVLKPAVSGPAVENNHGVSGPAVENNCGVSGPVAENNRSVSGPAVENNPTVNGTTVENNVSVESPVKFTKKEDPKKTRIAASTPPPNQMDVTKKTYASIVKFTKEGPPIPFAKPKPPPKPVTKPLTKAVEASDKPSVKALQVAEITQDDMNVTKNSTSHDGQGYSIFIKGLPFNSAVEMVEEEFKRFGGIKPGGIQVRNNKFDRFCFGFVEFESQQSMQAAIKASPIYINENKISVEEKRTATRVVNGVVTNASRGGRFQSGRAAHRGDNFRGQGGGYVNNGNYQGGDNFRRKDGDNFNRRDDSDNFNRPNEFRNRNEFTGRGRGPLHGNGYHHNGNGFHQPRPLQNENGRYTRVNVPKQTSVAA